MPSTDEGTTLAAPAEAKPPVNPAVANATHALALKELGEDVAKLRASVKKLWIAVAVVAVLAVAVGVTSFVPGARFAFGGRPNFRNGQFNGSFQGAPGGGTQSGTGQSTTGQ